MIVSTLYLVQALPALVLTLAPVPALPSSGGCLSVDGINTGGSCGPVAANLPSFPGFSIPTQTICWDACGAPSTDCAKVILGTPNPVTCSQFSASLDVQDCAGNLVLQGVVTLDYTRNWSEEQAPGQFNEVWRLAAKVDLADPTLASTGCPIPSCAQTPGSTAFYYGYVDYSMDCGSTTFDNVIVLYHGSDAFMHSPLLSSVPGVYHPTQSFALVGPDTLANPFAPGFQPPPTASPVATQSMRRTSLGCDGAASFPGGTLDNLISYCASPLSLSPAHQTASNFEAACCGWSYESLNVFPTAPWIEMTTTSIGRWSNLSSYPGPEHTSVAEGLFLYRDGCAPLNPPELYIDIFYGSITQQGFTVQPSFTNLLTDNVIDMASNYSLFLGSPFTLPVLGTVDATDHLIYCNL